MPIEFFLLHFLGPLGVLGVHRSSIWLRPQAALGLSVTDPWRIVFLWHTEGEPAADARGLTRIGAIIRVALPFWCSQWAARPSHNSANNGIIRSIIPRASLRSSFGRGRPIGSGVLCDSPVAADHFTGGTGHGRPSVSSAQDSKSDSLVPGEPASPEVAGPCVSPGLSGDSSVGPRSAVPDAAGRKPGKSAVARRRGGRSVGI